MHVSNFYNSFIILYIIALLNLSLDSIVINASDVKNYSNEEFEDISIFVTEIVQDLTHKLKKLPLALLKNKVISQTLRASESLNLPNPEDENCEINYSELCPNNWIYLGDGKHCLSPIEYKGPCEKKVSFHNATPLSKFTFSSKCNVTWPCINKCIQDYSQYCPKNWILQSDYSCQAPRKYKGKCIRRKSFENFSEIEKKTWAEECELEWPCKKKNYDFSYLCPSLWKTNPDEKTCSAPNSYIGPCPNILYLYGLKDEEKIKLIEKCKIEWPIHNNTETFDFDSFCPLGWKLKDIKNQTCIAPISYTGPCRKEIDFVSFSKEEKYDFSKKCDVRWKSNDEKIQNFNLPCPYNWNLINKEENICLAPIEYDGQCANVFSFKNYSKEMKSIWALTCKTVFLNGNSNILKSFNEKSRNGILSNKRDIQMNQIKNVEEPTLSPSLHNGPIGIIGSKYAGNILEANNEIVYETNNKNIMNENDIIELNNIEDMKDKELIFTDDKIRDLKLLKESSTDEDFKKTVEQTIQDLKKRYSKGTSFSFIEYTKEDIDLVKNLYENFKIEKENISYKGLCKEKDYTQCPIGWTRINNKECLAPRSYIRSKRKCSSILPIGNINKRVYDVTHNMSFDMIDIKARKQLEKDCNINFPCKECERDYVRVQCPIGWTILDNGLCKAPNDYSNQLKKLCGDIVNFTYASPEFKRNWSYICKADWPCFSICQKNYGAICPIGYKLINERKELKDTIHVCINENWKESNRNINEDNNTLSYKQDTNLCHVIEVYNSVLLKKEIEQNCKVQWPCLEKCVENFYQTCPYGWIFNNNKCIAPYYYKPPIDCNNSFDIFSFSNLDKFIFSTKCFAPWPCQNSCQPDWNVICPDGWQKIKINHIEEKQKENINQEIEENINQEIEENIKNNKEEINEQEKKNKNELENKKIKNSYINKIEYINEDNNDIEKLYKNLKNKEQMKYTCKPPKEYNGNCNDSYDFINFTFAQKQDFSFKCNVKWPCGQKVHHTQNWQKKNIYIDQNFQDFKTLKHYNPEYINSYNKYENLFI